MLTHLPHFAVCQLERQLAPGGVSDRADDKLVDFIYELALGDNNV